MPSRTNLIVVVVLLATIAFAKANKVVTEAHAYHAVVPLGIMKFTTNSDTRPMYLLVTAENPAFANWRTTDTHKMPRRADGTPVKYFPHHIDFRVTATAHTNELVGIDQYSLDLPPGSLNDFMTKLRFRVAIFEGLNKRIIEPENVANLGMPDDVSYDERVYRVGFDIGQRVPVEDRIVLEVLSPTGERIGRFHLEF